MDTLRFKACAKNLKNIFSPYPYAGYMRKHRCIFIHVPKTGGTSLLKCLGGERDRKHIPWFVFHQSNRFLFDRYYKFAVVRDPLNRIRSVHSYLINGGSRASSIDEELATTIRNQAATLDTFVFDYLTPGKMHLHNLFRPQSYFLFNAFGHLMVDQLCKLESIDSDIQKVWDALKRPAATLPHENRSSSGAASVSDDVAKRVRELYAIDYELLGYS